MTILKDVREGDRIKLTPATFQRFEEFNDVRLNDVYEVGYLLQSGLFCATNERTGDQYGFSLSEVTMYGVPDVAIDALESMLSKNEEEFSRAQKKYHESQGPDGDLTALRQMGTLKEDQVALRRVIQILQRERQND